MTDSVLAELWNTKDSIAKEHGYDIDNLSKFLQQKSKSRKGNIFQYNFKVEPNTYEPFPGQEKKLSR